MSFYASARPDGLERVAADKGFVERAQDHALADAPLAGYEVHGVDDARLSGGLAGVVGVVVIAGARRPALPGRRGRRERADAVGGPGARRDVLSGVSSGHAPPAVRPRRDSPVHRAAAARASWSPSSRSCWSWSPPRATWYGPSPATRCCSLAVVGVARVPPSYLLQADGRRGAVRGVRAAAAVRRARARRSRCSGCSLSEPGLLGAWNMLAKGTLGVLAIAAARGHHRAARAARRAGAAAAAAAAGADHGLHGPLPRRGHRRDAPDADRPGVARLHRPAIRGTGRSLAQVGRRAVHPLLRARRAGAPGDAGPGYTGAAGSRTAAAPPRTG